LTEDEVWTVIRMLPSDKVSGPGGFSASFLQLAWSIIRLDAMAVFDAFWYHDMRNVHNVNRALMTLLPKSSEADALKDYRPISLIHLISKLMSKVLANHLAQRLNELVHPSQCAFIRGRLLHDSFRFVQALARLLHVHRVLCLLLKVDIVRAFDSVAWPFLLEVLEHLGFPPGWQN
jgi:hypothetical protein